MKIQTIEITNYKAFLGTHKINVCGKNLFIYGENGSGKSSLYYALKDFFQSSIEDINLNELENIFVAKKKQGKTAIKVTFKPNRQGQNKPKNYHFSTIKNDARTAENDLPATTKANIEKYRSLVLNPFSHYNTERHEIKSELVNAIQAVKDLKQELSSM
ncbi:MAG: AAA family ATPase [Thermodesulfobacteriota bacterium]|nr:AAA family ATPase [Thermodesulfobacteriota bacterium]